MRRALIIASVVIVVAGLGVAAYFLFFAGSAALVVAPPSSGGTGFPSAGNTGGSGSPSGGAGNTATTSSAGTAPSGATAVSSRLVEIDKGPVVAGAIAIDVATTTASTTTHDIEVEYLNRQSGNVFSYLWNTRVLARLSSHTIPGIENAQWLNSGASVLVQYLSGADNTTVNTYALAASGASGFFLPQDVAGIAAGSEILYWASGANGSVGTIEKAAGGSSSQAFTTPLSQIRAQFAGGSYLVSTKPSAMLAGYAFLVSGTRWQPVAGPLNGLTALASPKGTYALISYASGGTLKAEVVNLKSGIVTALPLGTIADKCAWAADESALYCGVPIDPSTQYAYPDDWYQGAVHFSDRLWQISLASHVATLLLDFSTVAGAPLDATNLSVDPGGKVLIFRNKNDGSLWGYAL